jgi:type II secretory pathway component PulF
MEFSAVAAWSELDVARHKAEFYRMWHVGYRAGLPHEQVLTTMGQRTGSKSVEAMRRHLLAGAKTRASVTDTIDLDPTHFVPFEVGLLKLGEEAGGFDGMLELLGAYFETEHKRMLWVKKKMAYPMTNLIAAIFIVPFPILFFGDTARYLTIVTLETAVALAFGGTVVRWFARRYRNRPRVVLARLCRSLALGVESGLPIDRVLDLGIAVAADASLQRHVKLIPPDTRHAQPLSETLRGWERLPPEMHAALTVADNTGNYRDTLKRLADLYDDGF